MDFRGKIRTFSERYSTLIDETSTHIGKRFGEKYEIRAISLSKNILSLISSFLFLTFAGIFFVPMMFIEVSLSIFRYLASLELFSTVLDVVLTYVDLAIECIFMFWGYRAGDEKPYIFQTFITKVRDSNSSQSHVKLNGHSKGHKK